MGSFAPKGHARLDPQHPAAFAICDRCGFLYLHRDLAFQMAWFGDRINSTRFLVCPTCLDKPNPTMRPIKLPADPVPIYNPRDEKTHQHTRRNPGEPFPEPYEGLPDIPEE